MARPMKRFLPSWSSRQDSLRVPSCFTVCPAAHAVQRQSHRKRRQGVVHHFHSLRNEGDHLTSRMQVESARARMSQAARPEKGPVDDAPLSTQPRFSTALIRVAFLYPQTQRQRRPSIPAIPSSDQPQQTIHPCQRRHKEDLSRDAGVTTIHAEAIGRIQKLPGCAKASPERPVCDECVDRMPTQYRCIRVLHPKSSTPYKCWYCVSSWRGMS